eukprot:172089-Prorocentrum_lima.AAC.1
MDSKRAQCCGKRRERVLEELTWYSDYWKSYRHLLQSRMHPSFWITIKGPNALKEAKMAQPAPEDKIAETRTW